MTTSYHSFPFVQFCLLSADETKLEDLQIKKEDWDKVKEEYSLANPDSKNSVLVEAYKKFLFANIKKNKAISVMSYILQTECDWEEMFKSANIKYTGKPEKDLEYLNKQIKKEQTKEEIFKAQLEKLKKQIKESEEVVETKEFDINKVYEAIASLEKAGATIPNYDELTCGKYDALTKVYTKKNNGE